MNAYLTVGIVVAAIFELAFFMVWLRFKHKVKLRKKCTTYEEMWKRVVIFALIVVISSFLSLVLVSYVLATNNNTEWGFFVIMVFMPYLLIGMPTLLDKLNEYQELLIKSIKSQEA